MRKVKEAVSFVKSQRWRLCTSVDAPNWEIITAAAVIENVSIKLFIPETGPENFKEARHSAITEFELNDRAVEFEPVLLQNANSRKKDIWQFRDTVVIGNADFLLPISVRPMGSMSGMLQEAVARNKQVINNFQVPYDDTSPKLSYSIDKQQIAESLKDLEQKFVFHWTRASNGPWPNEKKIDYYRAILNSTEYPRNALDTLKRIIMGKIILGSSKNMPGETPTVSFTALAPINTVKLMKWRARYRQMTFEPYGIGIEMSTALSMGISEVQYFKAKSSKNSHSCPNWLTQSVGKVTDWRNEEEFRHLGNLDFRNVQADKLIAICHRRNEAIEVENKTGIKTIWFCD